MPNPSAHIDLALEGARQLSHPVLQDHLGSFILGCTAPDLRVITKRDRGETHFVSLSNDIIGAGAESMFKSYPRLAGTSRLSGPTVAFIAGYLSHLIADEMWIAHMYRPYFGDDGVFGDDVEGNIMDRTLQLELDLRATRAGRGLFEVREHLANAATGVEVDFLPQETLVQWQEWLITRSQVQFSWERLRFMLQRQYPDAEESGTIMRRVDRFITSLPQGLEQIFARVPSQDLETYREGTIREWARVTGEYLS